MHICFIGEIARPQVKTGGIGSFVANLVPALLSQGATVSVISYKQQTRDVETEEAEGFRIYWINTHQWGPLRWLKRALDTSRVLRQIHQQRPLNIVESSEAGLFLLRKPAGVSFVVRLHGGHRFFAASTADTPFSKKKAWFEQQSLKKADAIIGVSHYVLQQTAGFYPFLLQKPHTVIPNPILLHRFSTPASTQPVPGRLLFMGALTEKKGVRQLIMAMPAIVAKWPTAQLHIYGKDIAMRPSGASFKAVLQQLVAELNMETHIRIFEPIANVEVPGVLAAAEVVVLPSHMEAMPVAWLEAMAMGKAFVGSRTGPGPEVVQTGETGLLCDPFEPADIADKVLYMLQHPDEARRMGTRAKQLIQQQYGADHLAATNLQYFGQLQHPHP
ncbi:MAG: glycosyltransferase family 4 protein [Chitinophagaceae bacterium]|nr:glycosyltransferase family 4 protein [Chitinophagaceae bacterium]